MLVTGMHVLKHAHQHKYAVGAFNINNLEGLQAIIEAAVEERSPVIISTSEGAIHYAGMEELAALVHLAAKKHDIPIVFHLDHGKNIAVVEEAIRSELYTSVMFDGSSLPYEDNVRESKRLAGMARRRGISLEAELGAIAGIEDFVSVDERDAHLTDPDQAAEFVKRTGCDSLAVAVGTSHGAYKFTGDSKLDYDRLVRIKSSVNIPLVLHGASGVPTNIKKKCMEFGCEIAKAKGVSDDSIAKAIERGINKINIDTDLRIAFDAGIREFLHDEPEVIDPRKILAPGKELMKKIVKHKMRLFGSSNRA